jgi:hypothetical protein
MNRRHLRSLTSCALTVSNAPDALPALCLTLVHQHPKHVYIISPSNEATLYSPRAAAARFASIEALRNPGSPCLALQCSH